MLNHFTKGVEKTVKFATTADFRPTNLTWLSRSEGSGGFSIPESGLPSLLINSCMRFSNFCCRRLFMTTSGLEIVLVKLVSGMSL